MRIEGQVMALRVEALKPARDNPRLHSEPDVLALADSLAEFGCPQPIMAAAEDFEILAGHGRALAAAHVYRTGRTIPEVPAGCVPVLMVHEATPEERRAFRIADNRAGALGSFDPLTLAEELADLSGEGVPAHAIGFNELEASRLADTLATAQREGADAEPIVAGLSFEPPGTPHRRAPDGLVLLDVEIATADRETIEDALMRARDRFNVTQIGTALAAMVASVDAWQ